MWQQKIDEYSRAIRDIESENELTRNYVMFPGSEDSIRILRKYGILAPVAAGAAQQEQPSPIGGLIDQRQK